MYIHNLNPVALEFFGLKIYWYSLAYLLGFIFSVYYSKLIIKKGIIDLNTDIVDNFFSWAIIGVIFGGRLGYVIFYNFEFYIQNIIEIFKIWKGGMSFHGGLIGLTLSMYIFSRLNKIKFIDLSNLIACSAPFGIFLGRIANFINAELVGKPTFSDWGVKYYNEELLRHPSQLYEAFFEGLVLFLIIIFVIKRGFYKKVNLCAIFLVFYGLFRFVVEYFREPDNHIGLVIYNLSMGQILSIPIVILGFSIIKYGRKKNKTNF
ncbi:MAG: prolipoprotein diacylglyceryl transferase [Alphaproteobacteria bacterium]